MAYESLWKYTRAEIKQARESIGRWNRAVAEREAIEARGEDATTARKIESAHALAHKQLVDGFKRAAEKRAAKQKH